VTFAAAYFTISLIIGVVAAGVVVLLIALLLGNLAKIQRSVDGLLEVAGKVGANTANIPQLEATAPVLALIVEEAVVQDGYMNALTDGYGDS
jgi:predicted Zn-dependent protease